jgi:hypothetical protein
MPRAQTKSPRKGVEEGVVDATGDAALVGVEEESELATNEEDDANFAMARRNASIQHVLSWMDTGSSSMTREDSELGRNCTMVDDATQ